MRAFLAALLLCPLIAIAKPAHYTGNSTLHLAIELIRHGDRTPTKPLKRAAITWKLGPGQLTPKGMQQEYQLGRWFQQQYIQRYHLLTPNYQHQQVMVIALGLDRTLKCPLDKFTKEMSARLPKNWGTLCKIT